MCKYISNKLLSTCNFSAYTSDELVEDKTLINQGEVITFPSCGTASIKYHNGKFIDSGNILSGSKDNTKINLKNVINLHQKRQIKCFIYQFLMEKTGKLYNIKMEKKEI